MAAVSSSVLAATALLSTGYSMYQGYQQAKDAKKLQKQQQAQIAQEQKQAEDERRGLLRAQRYQLGLDNTYSTSGTSSSGRSLTTGESTLG